MPASRSRFEARGRAADDEVGRERPMHARSRKGRRTPGTVSPSENAAVPAPTRRAWPVPACAATAPAGARGDVGSTPSITPSHRRRLQQLAQRRCPGLLARRRPRPRRAPPRRAAAPPSRASTSTTCGPKRLWARCGISPISAPCRRRSRAHELPGAQSATMSQPRSPPALLERIDSVRAASANRRQPGFVVAARRRQAGGLGAGAAARRRCPASRQTGYGAQVRALAWAKRAGCASK